MSLRSYIFPQTIVRTSSTYNHDIRVNEEHGRYKLLVNGSRQSGSYIEMLWKKAFRTFAIVPNLAVKNILVLGVGGGTVIHMLQTVYPSATMIGVDIDKKILDIGKTYFELSAMSHLQLICKDANIAVHDFGKKGQRFDLIIIDLFSGRHIPEFVSSKAFLKTVATLLSPTGITLINFLRELEYREKSDFFNKTLNTLFRTVRDYTIVRNRFFYMVK